MSAVDLSNYQAFLVVLFGGGVGVTLVAQLFKKVFKTKAEEAHAVHLAVVALTVVTAAAQYVIQFKGKLPVDVLGVSTPVIYGVSQFVYKEAKYANAGLAQIYTQAQAQPTLAASTDAAVAAVDQAAAKVVAAPQAVEEDLP